MNKKPPVVAASRRLYTVDQAAAYLGISRRSVYTLIEHGSLKPVRLPDLRRMLLDVVELDRFVETYQKAG